MIKADLLNNLSIPASDIAKINLMHAEVMREAKSLPLRIFFVILLTGALLLCWGIETAILYHTFNKFAGADLPGDSNAHLILMSMGGALMIAGYHGVQRRFGETGIIRFLNRLTKTLIPLYFIGAAVLFAVLNAMDVTGYLKTLLGQMASTQTGWDPAPIEGSTTFPPVINWIIWIILPFGGLLFGLFSGGIAIVTLFVSNLILERLEPALRKLVNIFLRTKSFLQAHAAFKRSVKRLSHLTQEKALLQGVSREEREKKAVHGVLAEIQAGIRTFKYWKTVLVLEKPASVSLLPGGWDNPPPEGLTADKLDTLIAELEAITPQKIYRILHSEVTQGKEPNA